MGRFLPHFEDCGAKNWRDMTRVSKKNPNSLKLFDISMEFGYSVQWKPGTDRALNTEGQHICGVDVIVSKFEMP